MISVIRSGERVTFETFKDLVFTHFGLALDDNKISKEANHQALSAGIVTKVYVDPLKVLFLTIKTAFLGRP